VVADPTISAIDRFFDLVDNGVEKIDHVLNRGKHLEEKYRGRRGRTPDIIEANEVPKASKKEPSPAKKDASPASALTRKPRFYIVESVKSGSTLFVVTDGGNARTECSTREFAEKILRALEAAP
jgi:hypothetical protein